MRHEKKERIGRMNERCEVHFSTTTVNGYGERVPAWQLLGTYWAGVKYFPLRSKEDEAAGQETVMQAIEFTLRDNDEVHEAMRVYWRSRLYDIEGIGRDETKQYIQLQCKQYAQGEYVAPGSEGAIGDLMYLQSFTGSTSDTVTVTVYGGNLPTNKAQVWVTLNGQELQEYTIDGADIVLTGFSLVETDTLTVRFVV